MLASLRHWAVGRIHHEDCTVHLRSTGDHVLHIVSVTWAVDVSIVTIVGFIFHVRRRNRDTALTFFRGPVNFVIGLEVTKIFGDRRCQRGFTMVNVPDSADVGVGLITFKLFLGHSRISV